MMDRPVTCGPGRVGTVLHAGARRRSVDMGRSHDGAPAMPLETATEPPFGHLKHQMNKLLDQMQKGFYTFSPGETWTPNVNLYENETSYVVCVDLAGVVKEEIDLQLNRQSLTLRGNRRIPTQPAEAAPGGTTSDGGGGQAGKCRVHLLEIDHGPVV